MSLLWCHRVGIYIQREQQFKKMTTFGEIVGKHEQCYCFNYVLHVHGFVTVCPNESAPLNACIMTVLTATFSVRFGFWQDK